MTESERKPPIEIIEEEKTTKKQPGALGYAQEGSSGGKRGGSFSMKSLFMVVIAVLISLAVMVQYAGSKSDIKILDSNVKDVLTKIATTSDGLTAQTKRIDNIVSTLPEYMKKADAGAYAMKADLTAYAAKSDLTSTTTTLTSSVNNKVVELDSKFKSLSDNLTATINNGSGTVQAELSGSGTTYSLNVTVPEDGEYCAYVRLVYTTPPTMVATTLDEANAEFVKSLVNPNRTYMPKFVYMAYGAAYGATTPYRLVEVSFYTDARTFEAHTPLEFTLSIQGLPTGYGTFKPYLEILRGVVGTTSSGDTM